MVLKSENLNIQSIDKLQIRTIKLIKSILRLTFFKVMGGGTALVNKWLISLFMRGGYLTTIICSPLKLKILGVSLP